MHIRGSFLPNNYLMKTCHPSNAQTKDVQRQSSWGISLEVWCFPFPEWCFPSLGAFSSRNGVFLSLVVFFLPGVFCSLPFLCRVLVCVCIGCPGMSYSIAISIVLASVVLVLGDALGVLAFVVLFLNLFAPSCVFFFEMFLEGVWLWEKVGCLCICCFVLGRGVAARGGNLKKESWRGGWGVFIRGQVQCTEESHIYLCLMYI